MKRWITGRSRLIAVGVAGIVTAAAAVRAVTASDHQDSAFVEVNQRYDINDVYAFPAATPGRIALVMTTGSPLTPAQTVNHVFGNVSEELYQIKIDQTGDAREDLVFQITFSGPNNAQIVSVRGPLPPNETGVNNTLLTASPAVTGPTNTILGSSTGMQVFAGAKDDPFFIDLEQFFKILPDRRPEFGPLSQPRTQTATSFRPVGEAVDFLRGFNAQAIVIELPTTMLTNNGIHPRFGIWGTTSQISSAVGTAGNGHGNRHR